MFGFFFSLPFFFNASGAMIIRCTVIYYWNAIANRKTTYSDCTNRHTNTHTHRHARTHTQLSTCSFAHTLRVDIALTANPKTSYRLGPDYIFHTLHMAWLLKWNSTHTHTLILHSTRHGRILANHGPKPCIDDGIYSAIIYISCARRWFPECLFCFSHALQRHLPSASQLASTPSVTPSTSASSIAYQHQLTTPRQNRQIINKRTDGRTHTQTCSRTQCTAKEKNTIAKGH